MPPLSTHDFQKKLESDVRAICSEYGGSFDREADRGLAFQRWFGRLLCQSDRELDSDVEDALVKHPDLGVDLVLVDEDGQQQYLVQCKFTGTGKRAKSAEVDEEEVAAFFARHDQLMDRKWVRDHASDRALELLGDYTDKMNGGWRMHFWFVQTAIGSDRVRRLAETSNKRYSKAEVAVGCTLLDLAALKEYWLRTETIEQSVPDQIEMDLPANSFFEKTKPYPTVVARVKGNWLRNLYQRHRESLFAWNIRGYLGNRGLNRDMADTAEKQGRDFFYFNNGISAICTSYTLSGNKLVARKFQVINGAQTVGTLAKTDPNEDVEALFRLTQTGDVNIEKRINRSVIQFNNTQNVIKRSDFRSNDKIQLWLEARFKEARNYGSLPQLTYLRKRGQSAGPVKAVRLEEFAKIRYAFKYEPTVLYEAPKKLWTLREDGGVYERAFGDGELVLDQWTDEMFEEALFAIALSFRVDAAVDVEKRSGRSWMHRLRFHLLSLLGLCARGASSSLNVHGCLKAVKGTEEFWDRCWGDCRKLLIYDYMNHVGTGAQQMTLHAYMRSSDRWSTLQRTLSATLNLK